LIICSPPNQMVRANHTMLLEDNSLQSNTKPTKPRFNQLWKRYQLLHLVDLPVTLVK
jgi:hypothetical protein